VKTPTDNRPAIADPRITLRRYRALFSADTRELANEELAALLVPR
jgi:hypothetical protein